MFKNMTPAKQEFIVGLILFAIVATACCIDFAQKKNEIGTRTSQTENTK